MSERFLSHRTQKFPISEFSGTKGLQRMDELVIQAMCEGERFSEMSDVEISSALDKVIFRCAAITGAEMPTSELFANEIKDALHSMIVDSGYEDLTLKEIFLALQLNMHHDLKTPDVVDSVKIEFVGRCVHANFISKVLRVYMEIKKFTIRTLQNKIDGY
jgi:hypothetical protein